MTCSACRSLSTVAVDEAPLHGHGVEDVEVVAVAVVCGHPTEHVHRAIQARGGVLGSCCGQIAFEARPAVPGVVEGGEWVSEWEVSVSVYKIERDTRTERDTQRHTDTRTFLGLDQRLPPRRPAPPP